VLFIQLEQLRYQLARSAKSESLAKLQEKYVSIALMELGAILLEQQPSSIAKLVPHSKELGVTQEITCRMFQPRIIEFWTSQGTFIHAAQANRVWKLDTETRRVLKLTQALHVPLAVILISDNLGNA
jgi:hypothetical protein